MSMFPLLHGVTVGFKPHSPGTVVDGYQTGESWGTPVNVEGCGVTPGNGVEEFEPNRDGATVEYTVMAPPGTKVSRFDKAVLPNEPEEMDVIAHPKEWVNHFTGTSFGVVILVGRADG